MKKKNILLLIIAILLSSALAYGCGGGGSGTASISTGEPGDVYLPQNNTPSALIYSQAQESFNRGNFSNAQADFQKAYEAAATPRDQNRAITGTAWSIMKAAAADGKTSFDNDLVILTIGKIPKADFDNYKDQEMNDARVALAMAYLSKAQSLTDFQNAISAIEKIDAQAAGSTYTANKFFTYASTLSHGVNNAQVHAVLAYMYFLQGNKTTAVEQINYAFSLAPNDQTVVKIKAALTVLGAFR